MSNDRTQQERPYSWLWVKLEDVLELADSGIWGEPDPENGISILRSTNFNNDGTFNFENLSFCSIPEGKRIQKLLKPGDIVLERSGGGPNQPVGRVCYFEDEKSDHSFGNFCQRLRVQSGICDARYIFLHLYLFHLSGQTQLYQKQTTGIRNLEYKRYLSHELPLPPLPEQQRIAALLKEQLAAVDKARLAAQARLEAIKALPAAYLRQVFPTLGNILFSGWQWVKIGDITEVSTGGTPDTNHPEYYGGEFRWLKSGDIKGTYIEEVPNRITKIGLENSNARIHPVDTVMLAMSGQGKTRGTSAILKVPSACSQSVAAILPTKNAIPEYIHFALVSRYDETRRITGDNERTGLNLKLIREIPIPLAPLPEQHRIAALLKNQLTAVDKARQAAEEELDTINTIPSALLRRAFNGEL